MTSSMPGLEGLVSPDIPQNIVGRVLGDEFISDHVEVAHVLDGEGWPTQTLVVPAFNQEAFIRKCLGGISENITAPSDLVVILDCCTDGTESAVLSFVAASRSTLLSGRSPAHNVSNL